MLFLNNYDLSKFVPISIKSFDSISAIIQTCEENVLASVIGDDMLEFVENLFSQLPSKAITSGNVNKVLGSIPDMTNLSNTDQSLLKLCRKFLAPIIIINAYPKLDIILSEDGGRRAEESNVKTAYGYQKKDFIKSYTADADIALEKLYAFLEKNIDKYPLWAESSQKKDFDSLLVKSGSEYKTLITTSSPYGNYLAIRPKLIEMELLFQNEIGIDVLSRLREADLNPYEIALLLQIKKSLVYLATSATIPLVSVRMDDNGITIHSDTYSTSSADLDSRTNANLELISRYERKLADDGRSWLSQAKQFIVKNALHIGGAQLNNPAGHKVEYKRIYGIF